MSSIIIPNEWEPRPYQLPVLRYFAEGGKRAVLQWSRRLGKDDLSLHQTALFAMLEVGNYWHMLPQYAQARKAVWDAVDSHTGRRRIDWAFPKCLRARTNDSEMKITFKNGSTWQLCGSDSYDQLVGSGVKGVVFSEYALCRPEAWGYISPMLEENNGWAIFNYTVRGENHATQLGRYAQQTPSWFFSNVTAAQSGVFSQEQLQRIEQELIASYGMDQGQALFKQEYENDSGAAVPGSIYWRELQEVKDENRVRRVGHHPDYPVYTFWDLGVDDSTAIIFAQCYEGKIWLVDYVEDRNEGMPHYLRVLDNKASAHGYRYAELIIPHDGENRDWSTGRTRREMLENAGYKVRVLPAERVADGINAARLVFGRCVFDQDKTKRLLQALAHYQRKWDENKKTYSKEPLHDWASHGCDAFRYLAMGYSPRMEQPLATAQPERQGLTFADLMKRRGSRRIEDY